MKNWIARTLTLVIGAAVLTACSGSKTAAVPPQAPAEKPAAQAQKPAANTPAKPKAPAKKPAPKKPAPLKVATEWDFADLEKPMWGWTFPSPGVKQTPKGAFYARRKTGPGPRWSGANFPASDVKAVRVEFQVMTSEADGEQPTRLDVSKRPVLYWAAPDDIQGEEWPFSEDRKVPLYPVNPKNPNVFEGRVDKVKGWNGEIADLFISVPLPKDVGDEETPYSVFFRKILFLK